MGIFGTLPLKLSGYICLAEKAMRVRSNIKGMGVIPSHEFFFAGVFETFAQCDHMVDDVGVVGDDAGFESLDREGEDVGDYERGRCGTGAAEEEAHDFDGGAGFGYALLYAGGAVCHL